MCSSETKLKTCAIIFNKNKEKLQKKIINDLKQAIKQSPNELSIF